MATLDQLNALANAVPAMNQKAAQKQQAQNTVGLQQQIGGAQPQGSTVRAAQGVAPQAIQADVKAQSDATTATQQELAGKGGIAQQALDAQGSINAASQATQENAAKSQLATDENAQKLQQSRADLSMRKRVTGAEQASAQRLQKMGIDVDNSLQLATIRQRQQLDRLGGDVKDQILDSRLQFERDEMGRKFSNDRQLADYQLANAKTEQEFKDNMRELQQASDRKIQLLEVTERKILEALDRGYLSEKQQLDGQSRAKLIQMAADMKEKMRKAQAKARGQAAMISGAFTVAGAVAGGVIGSAAGGVGAVPGAAIGASVGGGVGTMVAGGVQQQEQ